MEIMKKKREVKKSNQLQTVVFFLLIIGAFDGTKKYLKNKILCVAGTPWQ